MAYELTIDEVRVLGSLIEKQNTTPDYYPLTLNGLLNACNQKSNREPVLTLTESRAVRALDALREAKLAWMVQSNDARVPKYEHNFDRHLGLTLQEVAVMCLLLLRGPQTVGELRGRSARIYPFESLDEVEITLETLTDREEPLVVKLPLQPGRKEARFMHLLSGEPDLSAFETHHASDSEAGHYDQDGLQSQVTALTEEVAGLRNTVVSLQDELAEFQAAFELFKAQFD